MKTSNSLFTTVIVKPEEITVANHFDYEEAKEILVKTLAHNFHLEKDEGLIFKNDGTGEANVVFNYRAYLSGETEIVASEGKQNRHIKVFFECPNCRGSRYKLVGDEDGDVIAYCQSSSCDGSILVL